MLLGEYYVTAWATVIGNRETQSLALRGKSNFVVPGV